MAASCALLIARTMRAFMGCVNHFSSREIIRLRHAFWAGEVRHLMRMSPEQCRAARAWLGWTQQKMASYARVGLSTIKEFEKGGRRTIPATLAAMQQTLERAGVTFVNDADGKPTGIQVCAMGPPPLL